MKCDVTDVAEDKKQLSIKLSDAEFEEQIDALILEMAKDAEFPGFRKGKVPVNHLKARIDKDKVRSDAMGRSINKYMVEAIEKEDLDVIAISELVPDQENLSFTAVLEIRPEIDLEGYDKLEVKIPPVLPTEEETAEIQKNYLKSFGELVDIGRPSIKGDHLTIDLKATYNGAEVDGLNVSDYVYELGSGTALPEMDKELEKVKVGDILEFNAKYPAEQGNMRVKVLVKKVQKNEIPELTDDLAKEISEFETAEEFKEDMLSQITESKRHSLWHLLQERVIAELSSLITVPLPESLIEGEIESIKNRIANESNIPDTQEDFFENSGLMEQIKEQAVSSIKNDLAFRAVIRKENITVEDSELEKAVNQVNEQIFALSKENTKAKDKRPDMGELKPDMAAIHSSLLRQNALLWLIERSNIKDDNNLDVDIENLKPKELETVKGSS